MKASAFLDQRKDEINSTLAVVRNEFGPVSDQQFNLRPNPKKWSAAECITHLNLTQEIYVPQMLVVIENKDKYPPAKNEFNHSWIGRMAYRAMQPKENNVISFKMKTFSKFQPADETLEKDAILDTFIKYQMDMLEVITGLGDIDPEKPKINSALGPIFKMGIGDALRFMIAHNMRHILQAQNALSLIK